MLKLFALEEALGDCVSENIRGDTRFGDGRLDSVVMGEASDDLANNSKDPVITSWIDLPTGSAPSSGGN